MTVESQKKERQEQELICEMELTPTTGPVIFQ
jgi:hypothetical protein